MLHTHTQFVCSIDCIDWAFQFYADVISAFVPILRNPYDYLLIAVCLLQYCWCFSHLWEEVAKRETTYTQRQHQQQYQQQQQHKQNDAQLHRDTRLNTKSVYYLVSPVRINKYRLMPFAVNDFEENLSVPLPFFHQKIYKSKSANR